MQRTPDHLFDQLVSLHRAQVNVDDSGAPVTSWPAVRIDIRARIVPRQGSIEQHFGRETTVRRWRLYLPGDVQARPGDRLLWQGQGMSVQSVCNVHEQSRFVVIDAQEINQP